MKNQEIKIESDSGRIDAFLTNFFKNEFDFSRSLIQKKIDNGDVLVNEKNISNNYSLLKGDVILFTFSKPTKSEAVAQKVDFEIIYEDNDLLIVNKPNNLVVHPGAGNPDKTLVNGLLYKIKDLSSIGGVLRPGIVHRLDKKTTGLLIVAKNDKSHKALTEMLSTNQIYKEYVALVHGVISTNKGIINAPIGRHSGNRKKMAVTEKNSKCAVTNFEVIDRFEKFTLVKCNIETGRTHQIRVHFSYIKNPILGDELYSFKEDTKIEFGQFLHAYKLKFKHPITNKEIEFKVAIPTEFNDKLKEVGGLEFHEYKL